MMMPSPSDDHTPPIQHITDGNELLAILIPAQFSKPGIHFFTPDELSQQLAYMNYSAGKVIPAHVHNPVHRDVLFTQEVLIIKKGKLRVDFYNSNRFYLQSRILQAGDVILLITGGHGFEVLEDIEMIEVKQGPYMGEQDKTRFEGIDVTQVKFVK
ncbi:hypothetical protein OOK60_03915 [Trichothermofontia sichuanensis B231]|uniref:hypothetical protein n=1 Tax=Trichothermofontia sichuanensis TaxID=3045816 RepID=UPI002246B362|nr:hypothetical protein OOK60_03915 [Trichothermofontia sichuanensis B231]